MAAFAQTDKYSTVNSRPHKFLIDLIYSIQRQRQTCTRFPMSTCLNLFELLEYEWLINLPADVTCLLYNSSTPQIYLPRKPSDPAQEALYIVKERVISLTLLFPLEIKRMIWIEILIWCEVRLKCTSLSCFVLIYINYLGLSRDTLDIIHTFANWHKYHSLGNFHQGLSPDPLTNFLGFHSWASDFSSYITVFPKFRSFCNFRSFINFVIFPIFVTWTIIPCNPLTTNCVIPGWAGKLS